MSTISAAGGNKNKMKRGKAIQGNQGAPSSPGMAMNNTSGKSGSASVSKSPSSNTVNGKSRVQQPLEPHDELIQILKGGNKNEIMQALDSGKYKDSADKVGVFRVSPLHYACKNKFGYSVTKRILEDFGADPNIEDWREQTPLHYAVQGNSTEKVWLLLQNKADPMAKNKDGNTPLHFACAQKNLTMLRILLDAVDDVNLVNKWNYTPLHIACENKLCKEHNGMLQMLLDKGAAVNEINEFGKTPMLRLAELGHVVGAAHLLQNENVTDFKDVVKSAPWNGFKIFLAFRLKKKCKAAMLSFLSEIAKGLDDQVKVELNMDVRKDLLEKEEW